MKRWLLGVGLLLANLVNAHADIITQWNFNGQAPGVENSPTPSIGVGAASLVGGVTSTGFSSGTANGGSSDPALTGNFGWQTTTYAAQGTANRSRGVQFNVSTVGKQDIVVSFDLRHSNTSAIRHRVMNNFSTHSTGLISSIAHYSTVMLEILGSTIEQSIYPL